MKKLDMAGLRALKDGKGEAAEAPEKANFQGNPLRCVITDDVTGEIVVETVLTARGFKAKENKRTGQTVGGVGWYSSPAEGDCRTYRDLPVNVGLRVSLDSIKVEPGTEIDLRSDSDGNDLAE